MNKKILAAVCLFLAVCMFGQNTKPGKIYASKLEENFIFSTSAAQEQTEPNQSFIKWVDLNVSYNMLNAAYVMHKKSAGNHNIAEVLAYVSLKNGNRFSLKEDTAILQSLKEKLEQGQTIEQMVGQNKYYKYYKEVYQTVISPHVNTDDKGNTKITSYYPVAKGHYIKEGDDFGNSRNYGFKRRHLGHDMFGSSGAPIVAVEGGQITELGWNRFGGWRIGIRSHDTKRYYYYAHLRKDNPYAEGLKIGDQVQAGQLIGFLGRTGYSYKENVNMDCKPHLHFGIQLIFDKSQEDGNGEIWINPYNLIKMLKQNKAHLAE